MEEAQLAQHGEAFLVVERGVHAAQLLVHAGQVGRELGAVAIALLGLLLERAHDDGLELLRELGPYVAQGLWRRLHHLAQQLAERAGAERSLAAQHLVHHRAERIEVGARVERVALHLLGRHVGRAAGHALEARDLGIGDQRDAEIDDAHVAILGEQDVRRLDVAVHHAARVRVVQRLCDLVDDLHDLLDGQQAAGTAVRRQCARAVDVLGDDVTPPLLLARIVDRHDVRVLELADHVRLAHEHAAGVAALGVVGAGGVVELDGDVAPVERVVRQVHGAGAAAADLVHDVILADALGHR